MSALKINATPLKFLQETQELQESLKKASIIKTPTDTKDEPTLNENHLFHMFVVNHKDTKIDLENIYKFKSRTALSFPKYFWACSTASSIKGHSKKYHNTL